MKRRYAVKPAGMTFEAFHTLIRDLAGVVPADAVVTVWVTPPDPPTLRDPGALLSFESEGSPVVMVRWGEETQ
jgi:hypothetical protein